MIKPLIDHRVVWPGEPLESTDKTYIYSPQGVESFEPIGLLKSKLKADNRLILRAITPKQSHLLPLSKAMRLQIALDELCELATAVVSWKPRHLHDMMVQSHDAGSIEFAVKRLKVELSLLRED